MITRSHRAVKTASNKTVKRESSSHARAPRAVRPIISEAVPSDAISMHYFKENKAVFFSWVSRYTWASPSTTAAKKKKSATHSSLEMIPLTSAVLGLHNNFNWSFMWVHKTLIWGRCAQHSNASFQILETLSRFLLKWFPLMHQVEVYHKVWIFLCITL